MRRKINNNYVLGACALMLLAMCLLSILQPIRFENKMAERESIVKERLLKIRTAEENYKKRHGVYTGDLGALVREKYLADSLQYIPFSEGKKFSLAATTLVGKSGKQTPLMECGAPFEDYLQGLNEDEIQAAIEKANNMGNYPGLKIGDITTDNNNAGNWQ